MVTELHQYVSIWLLRWRLKEALVWAVRGLGGGLAAGLGLSLAARLTPFLSLPTLLQWSLSLALGGFALAGAGALFWPRSALAAARTFDRLFALAERVSTALELSERPGDAPAWLRHDQAADALAAAKRVNV